MSLVSSQTLIEVNPVDTSSSLLDTRLKILLEVIGGDRTVKKEKQSHLRKMNNEIEWGLISQRGRTSRVKQVVLLTRTSLKFLVFPRTCPEVGLVHSSL